MFMKNLIEKKVLKNFQSYLFNEPAMYQAYEMGAHHV